jgi:hypothetical protein
MDAKAVVGGDGPQNCHQIKYFGKNETLSGHSNAPQTRLSVSPEGGQSVRSRLSRQGPRWLVHTIADDDRACERQPTARRRAAVRGSRTKIPAERLARPGRSLKRGTLAILANVAGGRCDVHHLSAG